MSQLSPVLDMTIFYLLSHFFFFFLINFCASLVAQLVKNSPAMQETLVQFLGQEDQLEKE